MFYFTLIGLTSFGLWLIKACGKSSNDNPINWNNIPEIKGGIKISHTITPDNPPSEQEWNNYIHSYYIGNKN